MSVSQLNVNELGPATPGGNTDFTGPSAPTYNGTPFAVGGSGSFAPTATAFIDVSHSLATASTHVYIVPTNSSAVTTKNSVRSPIVTTKSAGSFRVATANGAAFTGTETFEFLLFN